MGRPRVLAKTSRTASLVFVALLIVGCASHTGDQQSGAGDLEPEVTDADVAGMFAAVASEWCRPDRCANQYAVLDDFSGASQPSGVPIPGDVKQAIAEVLGAVSFVRPEQPGRGMLLLFGPMTMRRSDLVSVWGGSVCRASLCGGATEYLFIWEDGLWVPISAEDAGVEIRSWVS